MIVLNILGYFCRNKENSYAALNGIYWVFGAMYISLITTKIISAEESMYILSMYKNVL